MRNDQERRLVGIVGHEAAKFTKETRGQAQEIIAFLLQDPADVLVSGRCPLGGIDVWAEEMAIREGRKTLIYPPTVPKWDAPSPEVGFKQRNLMIAAMSDIVHCIVVQDLPGSFQGMKHPTCYHCKGRIPDHVKSGGCWTAWSCPQHQWWIL